MIDLLKKYAPTIKEMQESKIDFNGDNSAWHVSFVTEDLIALSGGFHEDRLVARKIAAAELIERSMFQSFSENHNKKEEWLINQYPTGCGFAAGFNVNTTKMRSLFEGLERWGLSQWVDKGYKLNVETSPPSSSSIDFFSSHFDKVIFLHRTIQYIDKGKLINILIGATVGYTSKGVFLGCRAGLNIEDVFEHSLLESFRHLILSTKKYQNSDFISKRLLYFSTDHSIVQKLIKDASIETWPKPNLLFSHCIELSDKGIFIARTIFKGWDSWHLGSEKRFLY